MSVFSLLKKEKSTELKNLESEGTFPLTPLQLPPCLGTVPWNSCAMVDLTIPLSWAFCFSLSLCWWWPTCPRLSGATLTHNPGSISHCSPDILPGCLDSASNLEWTHYLPQQAGSSFKSPHAGQGHRHPCGNSRLRTLTSSASPWALPFHRFFSPVNAPTWSPSQCLPPAGLFCGLLVVQVRMLFLLAEQMSSFLGFLLSVSLSSQLAQKCQTCGPPAPGSSPPLVPSWAH